MQRNGIKRTIKRRYHFYFWVIYFVFNVMRWGSYFGDFMYSFKSNLVEFPLHIILVYINVYYLVPRLILKKKYTLYFLWIFLSLALHYIIRSGLNLWLVTEDIWPEVEGRLAPFGLNHILAVTIGELYVLGLTTAIKFTVDFIKERDANTDLRELQFQTELNFLRAQIQPHFFFNTLNNLYALTLKKSEKAPYVVLKLSDIMKYVLYETSKKRIPLLKEIDHIDNYIELEKVRFGNYVTSKVEINGNIDEVAVVPLLFLPFVENAFKHGPSKTGKMKMSLNFTITQEVLHFEVINTCAPCDSFF
ncbi:sensor histidine kinase [Aquimarina intermedia]|uniref:Histidine kinase n=1 Tax=Aquimarina intermedia TaxID=350814 RepID=A0A5S5CBE6_9FLAO|nr:histidine kinase [Aquimarina intermedia]TYP75832.1 histidine kinase [Aquimarina intermedia]